MSEIIGWLRGAGSDLITGLDDAACGWEELVSSKRKERLETAAARLQRTLDNVRTIEQLYGELTRSHGEVMQAVALGANKFSATFARRGEGWGLDTLRVARTTGALVSGVAATGGLVAKAAGYISTLWSSGGAAAGAAVSATGAEMVVISNLVAVGANSTAISNATAATTAAVTVTNATKLQAFASTAGKVTLVAGAIVLILQTVLQGIEVAHLRNELKRVDGERAKLAPALVDINKLMAALLLELEAVYIKVALEEGGVHIVELKNAEGRGKSTVELETFFANIKALVALMDTATTADQKKFNDLRTKVSSQNAIVRAGLSQKLIAAGASVTVTQSKLDTAFESLKEKLSVAQVAKITKLDVKLVQQLADLCAGGKDLEKFAPRMSMDSKGEVSITLEAA